RGEAMESISTRCLRARSVRALSMFLVFASASLAAFVACTGDDDVFKETPGGNLDSGNPSPSPTNDASGGEGGTPGVCGDAAGVPQRALLVQGNVTPAELVAVNLGTAAVDGRMP